MLNSEESNKILTEVIRRQMAILGPDITLAKVKNVPGLEVDANGIVIKAEGDTQIILQNLINQFVELSGLIVKKTMESIIMGTAGAAKAAVQQAASPPLAEVSTQQTQGQGQVPEGYSGTQPQVSPQTQPQPQTQAKTQNDPDSNIASANKDIEDLNKMLNNLNYNPPQAGGNKQ